MDDGQFARLPWWLRPLDGGPTWGSLDSYPRRFGVKRYRLVVFPPGISPEERRLLRLWRSWPVWGALLWACILYDADSLRDQGKLSAIGHEAACWRVYDRMAPEPLNAHPSGGGSPERPGRTT
jgi:hypothetical protein